MTVSAAVAKMEEKVEAEVELQREDLVKVLVIDDDRGILDVWERLFRDAGYDTDTAEDPNQAIEKLHENIYELVISDVFFDKTPVTGSQFILENRELLSSSTVLAVTGQGMDNVPRQDELRKLKIPILQKGDIDQALLRFAARTVDDRKLELARIGQQSIEEAIVRTRRPQFSTIEDRNPRHVVAESLLAELETTLVDWLRNREDPDKRTIVFGNRSFSANEIADEIRKGSEIGRIHIEGMLDLFKHVMNLK